MAYRKPPQQPQQQQPQPQQQQHHQQQSQHQAQDYGVRPHVPHIQTTQPTQYYPPFPRAHPQRSQQVPSSHSHYSSPNHSKTAYPRGYDDSSLTILSHTPSSGVEGSNFTVYVQSQTDLTADPRVFKFIFGSYRCSATPAKCDDRPNSAYAISCQVPSSTVTGWMAAQVDVYLVIEDEEGQELSTTDVGSFTYTDIAPRKRKMSADPEEARNSSKRIRPKSEDYGPYNYTPGGVTTGYSPYVPATSPAGGNYTPIVSADLAYRSPYQQSPSRSYTYNGYQATSETQPQAIVTPQHMQHWAHTYPTPAGGASVPGSIPPTPSSSKIQPTVPSPQDANPPLVRTSTLQTHPNNAGSGSSFNPYGIYPHTSKAVLNIEGDLDSVAAAPWSPEEVENRRKIVQFWRHQKGATINTNFAVVATNERQPNSICISCIYWEEKGECYVTSVDCIYLLESLISVRFTVEEKNRIRRNLEGFRPMTVSKAKADSENFFKLIMAFPNPKPRNIEKDVKVFPWKILGMAMKKIIGKYSASYSSTAAVLPQPPNSQPYQTAPSNEPTVPAAESLPVTHPPAADVISSGPSSSTLTRTTGSPAKHHLPKDQPITRQPSKSALDSQPPAMVHQPLSSQATQMWPSHQPPPVTPKIHGPPWDSLGYDTAALATVPPTQAIHYQRGQYSSEKRDNPSVTNHNLPSNGP